MLPGKSSYVDKIKVNEIFKKKTNKDAFIEMKIEEREKERIKNNKIAYENLKQELEKDEYKINFQLKDGRTPLFFSATNGNLDAVKYLLEKGADTEITEHEMGNTPLMSAIYMGHADVCLHLITGGANIHAKNKIGDTPIHFATILGNYTIMKFLHKMGGDINQKNNEGNSCIHYATGNNFFDCFKYLIDEGVDLDVIDCDNKHFFDLIINNKNKVMMSYLHGMSLIKKDFKIALLMGIILNNDGNPNGNKNIINLIEKYNAEYNYVYKNKMTALHYAIRVNNKEIIEYLSEKNYNLAIPSLLHYCIDQKNDYFLIILLKNKTVLLNEYNSDYVSTPLERAVLTNNIKAVDILLLNDTNPNISGSGNYSALYFAIMSQNYEMVKLLVDNGADVNNILNPYSLTSIHGIDNRKGDSMLRYAMRCWNKDIIKLLESKNAIIQSEY
jgi:ankyrin repeat protein